MAMTFHSIVCACASYLPEKITSPLPAKSHLRSRHSVSVNGKGSICPPSADMIAAELDRKTVWPDGLRRNTSIPVPREKAPATSKSAAGTIVVPSLSF